MATTLARRLLKIDPNLIWHILSYLSLFDLMSIYTAEIPVVHFEVAWLIGQTFDKNLGFDMPITKLWDYWSFYNYQLCQRLEPPGIHCPDCENQDREEFWFQLGDRED